MKRAQYTERGPNPQASIEAVEFTLPELAAGQALVEVLAAPINPSDVLTLTGLYGMLPPLPAAATASTLVRSRRSASPLAPDDGVCPVPG